MSALAQSAASAEKSGQNAVVEIQVKTQNSTSATVDISAAAINNISNATNAAVSVNTNIATVTFDQKAIDSISGAASSGNVSISIAAVDKTTLSQETKNTVGSRPVYDFSVTAGGGKLSTFGGGSVSVSIPYTTSVGEDPNAIVVYYVDSSNKLQTVQGFYDKSTGKVNFETTHFLST